MATVTIHQLLNSGIHFGHQARRRDPKVKYFILVECSGIYIIDLQQFIEGVNTAYNLVKEIVTCGGSTLLVGTRKQAQTAVAEQAQRVGMLYINRRWLGGMLINFSTMRVRLNRMKELEQTSFDSVVGSGRTKRELLMMHREKDRLQRTLGSIRDVGKLPTAVWIMGAKKEHLAISKAQKLRTPVITILDTNYDPDETTYDIPGDDDVIRAVTLLTRIVTGATAEGLLARSGERTRTGEKTEIAPVDVGSSPRWETQSLAGAEAEAAEVAAEVAGAVVGVPTTE